jgi:ferredoxin--NADP+ reductase
VTTADGWRAIDARERSLGAAQDRPRVKLATREQLLAAAEATG